MARSRIKTITGLLVPALLLLSQSALAHGDHDHAEGLMHVVAHFFESMDQPLLFGAGIAVMLVLLLMIRSAAHKDDAD